MWIRFLPSAEGPAWLPPAASWRVSSSFSISEHTRSISGPVGGVLKTKGKKGKCSRDRVPVTQEVGRSREKLRHQASGLRNSELIRCTRIAGEFLLFRPH